MDGETREEPTVLDLVCGLWDEEHRSCLLYCEGGMVLECVTHGDVRPAPRPARTPPP